jgi:sugar (pentulose or hexulose) kinase
MDALDDLIKVKRVVEPQEADRAVYERMYPTFRQFYAALAPIYRSSATDG